MSTDDTFVEVKRRLTAAPERVFSAFAEASFVARWLTPSPDIKLEVLQFDFREGGGYRFAYRVPGAPTVIVGGSYRVIESPSRVVFTWIIEPPDVHAGIESEVTVTITPDGSGSQLLIRHERLIRADAMARHDEGWRGALDQLAAILLERTS
jgi:uncharacterized protein YndB with AHSA1/START domain